MLLRKTMKSLKEKNQQKYKQQQLNKKSKDNK